MECGEIECTPTLLQLTAVLTERWVNEMEDHKENTFEKAAGKETSSEKKQTSFVEKEAGKKQASFVAEGMGEKPKRRKYKKVPVDLDEVEINPHDSKEKRIRSFLKQVKNPYLVKIDGITVEMEYNEDGPTMQEAVEQLMKF